MKNAIPVIVSLFSALMLQGCGGGSSDDAYPVAFEIPFTARVANSAEIACGQTFSPNTTDGEFKSFAFYAHDFRLVTDDDREIPLTLDSTDWQYAGVVLIDFQDLDNTCAGSAKPTNTLVTGTASSAQLAGSTLAGLRFKLGVPATLNHGDRATAPSPLNRLDMHWNWQNGYKFARMDFAPDGGVTLSSGSATTFNFHLGSTGCTPDPVVDSLTAVTCTAPNRPDIEVQLGGVDLENAAVKVDYQQLVNYETINADAGGAAGCMSGATDPECDTLFDALGLGINGAADPNPGQTVFSIIDTSI